MTKFRNKQIFGSKVTPYNVELFHFHTKPFILGSKIFAIYFQLIETYNVTQALKRVK